MKKKRTAWNKGKPWDEATKIKISNSKMGQVSPNKGKIASEETRKKQSQWDRKDLKKDKSDPPPRNLVGQKFNRWTVLSFDERVAKKDGWIMYWKCQCDCGKIKNVNQSQLTTGRSKSCGCYRTELQMGKHNLPDNLAAKNVIFNTYKRQAKNREILFELSFREVCSLIENNCFYCGIAPSNKLSFKYSTPDYFYNGIDRVDNAEGYTLDNCVSCCHNCNWCKKDFTQNEFFNHIKSIYEKHFK